MAQHIGVHFDVKKKKKKPQTTNNKTNTNQPRSISEKLDENYSQKVKVIEKIRIMLFIFMEFFESAHRNSFF